MKTVKLGLIGAGGIAQAHCGTLADIEGAEIIAAADLVPANLERAKERWGIKRTFTITTKCSKWTRLRRSMCVHLQVCMHHRRSLR